MANHKSALKRARQDEKRRLRNRQVRTRVRSAVKTLRTAIESGDHPSAQTALREAERLIRRAASKGVIPAARADRSVSRLSKAVHQLSS